MDSPDPEDDYYKTRYTFDPGRRVVWTEIVRYLAPYIRPDSVVLDLGAGYCDFINQVRAARKYALDISPHLPRYARSDVTALVSPSSDIREIGEGAVDVVHASNFLEHLDDDALSKTMVEIKRILQRQGLLILMQPNYRLTGEKYFDDPTHKRIFDDRSLEDFLKGQGFEIVLKKPEFLPFSMDSRPSLLPINRYLVRAYLHSPFKPFAGQMLFVARKGAV